MAVNEDTIQTEWPDVAIPPGDGMREDLEEVGLSAVEFAGKSGIALHVINNVLSGDYAITPEFAIQFENIVGTPARLLLAQEKDFRYNKARLETLAAIAQNKKTNEDLEQNLEKEVI